MHEAFKAEAAHSEPMLSVLGLGHMIQGLGGTAHPRRDMMSPFFTYSELKSFPLFSRTHIVCSNLMMDEGLIVLEMRKWV